MTLRTLNYGNYGIFLIMGNAGFCPSAVRILTRLPKIIIVVTITANTGFLSEKNTSNDKNGNHHQGYKLYA